MPTRYTTIEGKWIVEHVEYSLEEFKNDFWTRSDRWENIRPIKMSPPYSWYIYVSCSEQQAIEISHWFCNNVVFMGIKECFYEAGTLILDCGILGSGGAQSGIGRTRNYIQEYIKSHPSVSLF